MRPGEHNPTQQASIDTTQLIFITKSLTENWSTMKHHSHWNPVTLLGLSRSSSIQNTQATKRLARIRKSMWTKRRACDGLHYTATVKDTLLELLILKYKNGTQSRSENSFETWRATVECTMFAQTIAIYSRANSLNYLGRKFKKRIQRT